MAKLKMWVVSVALAGGCASPLAPTVDCLSPELESTYDKLEGVREGDPDYKDAQLWAAICPHWGLLK